jgi:hypothetical protein
MHFSTLIAAFAATARAYEAVLYEEGGYLGKEASFSFDGHHPLEYALYIQQPLHPRFALSNRVSAASTPTHGNGSRAGMMDAASVSATSSQSCATGAAAREV